MKTLSKLALISSIVVLPALAQAEPYVGIGVGETMTTFSRTLTFDDFSGKISSYYTSPRGQVLLGYNLHLYNFFVPKNSPNCTVIERAYLAFEVQGNYNGEYAYTNIGIPAGAFDVTPTTASLNEKINYSYDFIALVKTHITPSLTVLIGPGYSRGKYNVSGSVNSAGSSVNINNSKWLSGWTAKMGAELTLTKNLGFVGTYQYTNYGNNSWTRTNPTTGLSVTNKYKPMVNSLMIGLNWYFV